jgi:hypothetical protein
VNSEGLAASIAVLTRRGSWFGERVLSGLASRGVRPAIIAVEHTPFSTRVRMARRLAGRIGWVDAARYNAIFWKPLLRRRLGLQRTPDFPYCDYADRLVEASSINAPEIASALESASIRRVLLAQSGIVRERILSLPDVWIVNSHPAALPMMRGVDVVRWSILKGVEPAITVHQVDKGVDTGPILYRETVKPRRGETLAGFERRIIELSADRLVECGLAVPQRSAPASSTI